MRTLGATTTVAIVGAGMAQVAALARRHGPARPGQRQRGGPAADIRRHRGAAA